tara:strand:- start:3737 stop:4555 length:819 start_codon:yes stop_codon:yes gene_type:complete
MDDFTQYLQDVRTRRGKLADKTIVLYARYARRWGDEDPVQWVHNYLENGCAKGTACGLVATLSHYCDFTNESFDRYSLPMPSSEQYVRKGFALSEEELQAFTEGVGESGIDEPIFTILLLLPKTGLRIEEICHLSAKALKLQGRKRGLEVTGKGNKRRWVPLTDGANRVLRTYLKDEKPKGDFLFPSPRIAGAPIAPDSVRCALRELRQDLPGNCQFMTPHILRHTVATRLLSNGVDLATVQAILGHANIATTAMYLHPTTDMLSEAMNLVE